MAGKTRTKVGGIQLINEFLDSDGSGFANVAKSMSDICKDPLQSLLIAIHAMSTRLHQSVVELKEEVAELRNENTSLRNQNRELSDRVMRAEAYSGRATSIISNVPQPAGKDEDTAAVATSIIQKVIPNFSRDRISVAHRNRERERGDTRPRTITVVFSRISDKDYVSDYRHQGALRQKKIGLFHYAPQSIVKRKQELMALDFVEKCYWDGPNRLFSVKVAGEEKFKRNVLSENDLRK